MPWLCVLQGDTESGSGGDGDGDGCSVDRSFGFVRVHDDVEPDRLYAFLLVSRGPSKAGVQGCRGPIALLPSMSY